MLGGVPQIGILLLCGRCRAEEKMTLRKLDGQRLRNQNKDKLLLRYGTYHQSSWRNSGYVTSEKRRGGTNLHRHDLYGFVDHPQLQQGYPMNEFAPHRLPQPKGNMNGWLIEDEEEVERNEVDSDLESTASSKPVWKKTNKADHNRASLMEEMVVVVEMEMVGTTDALSRHSNLVIPRSMMGKEVRYAASSLVNKALTWWNTQVQARGRVAAMAMTWNDFKALMVEEFCPSNEMEKLDNKFWNHKMIGANHATYTDRGMLQATQPTTIQNAILMAGILTDEAVSYGTLTKGSDKRKGVEESSKTRGSGKDNKKAKVEIGFVATTPPRNETVGYYPRCSKCYTHHPENGSCRLCFNCQRPVHFAKDCRAPIR
ncbi:reverse transcriptase domain-containing protein [Tanacetum coccineum]|uniref:Reverse transcriptase domain-containing protein n=1 Tax=Tanacetum coccineum TaxID=301880 RepID=A0ABQ5IP96_9ASTR